MYNITHVYIPINRNGRREEYREWCINNVSPYSTEITWIMVERPVSSTIIDFYEASDALAFKLRFGL